MDEYFADRENLQAVVSLIDARHAPTRDDLDMIEYFKETNRTVLIGATKIDKVPKTKRLAHLKMLSKALQIPLKNIYPISSVEKTGLDEIDLAIRKTIGVEVEQ